jgi:hypothetical protein
VAGHQRIINKEVNMQQSLDLHFKNPDLELIELMRQDAIKWKERQARKELGISLEGCEYDENGEITRESFHRLKLHNTGFQEKRGQAYYTPCTIHLMRF